jgi:uncharacterized protein with PIN domain
LFRAERLAKPLKATQHISMKTDIAPVAPGCLLLTRVHRASDRRRVLLERNRVLARIEAAVERMEDGRFGVCLQCQGQIPMDCLEADPVLTRCPDCAGLC